MPGQDRTGPQLHQEDPGCKYWVSTDTFTKWGTALRMPSALTKGIKPWRLRLWNSATIGDGGQVREPGQKAMEDLTVAEKPVLSTYYNVPMLGANLPAVWTGPWYRVLHNIKQIKVYPNLQHPAGQETAVCLHSTQHNMALCYWGLQRRTKQATRIAIF